MPLPPAVRLSGDATIVDMATLNDIAAALTVIPERELRGLRVAINNSPDLPHRPVGVARGCRRLGAELRRGFLYHLLGHRGD